MQPNSKVVLVSGGAGYIGSHVTNLLMARGYEVVVVDSLVSGNKWAGEKANHFYQTDVGDAASIARICATHNPVAALHFAAFIEVGESVKNPEKYMTNNYEKAKIFFDTISSCGVKNVVFSSTAAVYGDVKGDAKLTEDLPKEPINPYGESKLKAETYLRTIQGVKSVTLRYFNVAGANPEAGLGETHYPETHLLPRIILPLINAPTDVQDVLGLAKGFKIFGTDYPTPDGTAVRDYIHVMDLADAHVRALGYLLKGGETNIFNLGSGSGFSVKQIVDAAREVLNRADFDPGKEPRREGDPAFLVADSANAQKVLGWEPQRDVTQMVDDAAAWHSTDTYVETIRRKSGLKLG